MSPPRGGGHTKSSLISRAGCKHMGNYEAAIALGAICTVVATRRTADAPYVARMKPRIIQSCPRFAGPREEFLDGMTTPELLGRRMLEDADDWRKVCSFAEIAMEELR